MMLYKAIREFLGTKLPIFPFSSSCFCSSTVSASALSTAVTNTLTQSHKSTLSSVPQRKAETGP